MRGRIKRPGIVILAILMILQIFAPCVYAREGVDTDAVTGLEVKFLPEGKVMAEGVTFRLYKIGDMDYTSEYTLLDKYAAYDLAIEPTISQDGWKALASTICAYINADGIEADHTAVTDDEGIASFADLSVGLYLVVGEDFNANKKIYTPDTFIVSLPGLDENEKWVYDVSVDVKYESRPDSEPVDVEVIKVWDDGEGSDRPESITVELYDQDIILDTVILDKTNDWSYLWEDIYGGTTYSVVEKDVPQGYKVTIEKQGVAFVITNKAPEPPKEPELPYTGMLWWPVPVLISAGLVLIILGYLNNRREFCEK